MNRRGFSFLEEEYSKDYLNNFPEDAWQALSKEVQDILGPSLISLFSIRTSQEMDIFSI
jgi:hypothetical protein